MKAEIAAPMAQRTRHRRPVAERQSGDLPGENIDDPRPPDRLGDDQDLDDGDDGGVGEAGKDLRRGNEAEEKRRREPGERNDLDMPAVERKRHHQAGKKRQNRDLFERHRPGGPAPMRPARLAASSPIRKPFRSGKSHRLPASRRAVGEVYG